MGSNFMDMERESSKKAGCQRWHVAVLCSLLIAIGLGVGLGVGLSNQKTVVVVEDTTAVVPITTTTARPTEPSTPAGQGPWQNYRLPDYVIPFHYKLLLHPNMSTDTYTGSNAMSLNITQETKYIVVHADAQLSITASMLEHQSNKFKIVREFRVPEWEYYVVEIETELKPGSGYVLTMEFQGSLVGKIVGLYKAEYVVPDTGETKAMVGSDMEPTDARKAYPCFDEPAMKVRYSTTLVHEPHHVALSNMNVQSNETRPDGLVATTFNESVPMPTYLGCFAIGEFIYIQALSEKNQIPLRVYIAPHQKETGRADYALDVMKKQFDFYEELFGIDYSLPKLDMISIPNFGTGAMENWGLITYRETNLLWDPVESSTYNKQRVAAVVAHELVHQWFGNLVTMKWWDNIWLNEGFASYLEYFGEDVAEPDWQIHDHVVIDDLQRVMPTDSTVTSHPIVVPVTSPSEITSVFDTISYSKGATVLRYLNTVLGNDTFFGGLRNYLKKRQFDNADDKDLFADMQEYADDMEHDVNITSVMNPWILQMGFPVISVERNGTVKQDRFLLDPNADPTKPPNSPFNYTWNINLTYVTSNNSEVQQEEFDLTQSSIDLNFGTLQSDDWVKLNPGVTGYYRVDYEDAIWETIAQQLMTNMTVFTELDRSHLIDDAFNLAPATLLTYPQALNMTRYLDNERSFFVWTAFNRGNSYIQSMLESTNLFPDFQEYFLSKVKPTADWLGWNASVGSHVEKRNRALVLSLALSYGDADALDNATELFDAWINDENYYLYPDIRQLVYQYGVIKADTDQWEKMLQRYVHEEVASEKSNLLRGLTSTQEIMLIDRMLDNCWNESIVKSGDFFDCVTYISYTPIGNRMAWNWVQLYWEQMVERYGITSRNLGRLVPNIVRNYNTELLLWEVENFFERYPEAGAGESERVSVVNTIKTNIAWMADNQEVIATWLQNELRGEHSRAQ